MELGISVVSVTPLLHPGDIGLLCQSKIKTFELHPAIFGDGGDAVKRQLKESLAQAGKRAVSYHIPFGWQYDISMGEEAARKSSMAEVRGFLAEAQFFGCSTVVLHCSFEPIPERERKRRMIQLRTSLLELAGDLHACNLTMALELLPRSCMGNSVMELLQILENMPDCYGICLDVNHFMDQYRSIPESILLLGSRIYALHISDYDGIDEKHWLPGTGVIQWREVIRALRKINYQGSFHYEINPAADTTAGSIQIIEQNYQELFAQD